MSDSADFSLKVSRTRRNALKMGGIAATAAVAALASSRRGTAQAATSPVPATHCMLKGTAVATANGPRNVEELAIGDLVPTMYGGMRPILWIGRHTVKRSDSSKPWPRSLQPIHIVRSAIGPSVPRRDLYLSAEHTLLVDGVLVTAGSLVNDVTIRRSEASGYDELEYFHVKVEGHDVIYAEGAPVETLLKADESFENFDEYVYLYGELCEATPCAPFVSCTGIRREFRSRARSAMAPWFDRRQAVDIIRDRLEERALSQELEAA